MSVFTPRYLLEALKQISCDFIANDSSSLVSPDLNLETGSNLKATPPHNVAIGRFIVAYSGGLDSHVLLHAMVALCEKLNGELHAVHINHALNSDSKKWSEHCKLQCSGLGIPFVSVTIDAQHKSGESPESAARKSRYSAFESLLQEGDCLMTAHHQDDQAETLMLQLMRGGGVHGLSAMPEQRTLKKGVHIRPLLGFKRADLLQYAKDQNLSWIEDPSNVEIDFMRNYLRHEVMPQLRKQWPGSSQTISRSALLCSDASRLIDEVAADDLSAVKTADKNVISLEKFVVYSEHRQRNILRYWFVVLGLNQPNMKHIQQIMKNILTASEDRNPLVSWSGVEVRRYRGRMYAMKKLQPFDSKTEKQWDVDSHVDLEIAGGMLCAEKAEGQGLDYALCSEGEVTVKFRRGGERCRVAGQVHHTELKKIFQQRAVPPWWRNRIPLIYINNELAAIAGLLVCDEFSVKAGQTGLSLSWHQKQCQ